MCKASGDDCPEDTILVASHQIPGDEAPQGCGEERKLSIPQMIRQCDHTVREIGCIQTKATSSMSADAGILGDDTLKITFQEVGQQGEVINRAAHAIDEIEGRAVAPDPKVNRTGSVFDCLKWDLLSKFTENDLPGDGGGAPIERGRGKTGGVRFSSRQRLRTGRLTALGGGAIPRSMLKILRGCGEIFGDFPKGCSEVRVWHLKRSQIES